MLSFLRNGIANHPCCRVLASAIFKFLVNRDKKVFAMHTAFVVHHSKPFGKLVNGPMLEAKEGCAWLEDVDEYIMVRFGQYLYTGDYATAEPDILIDASNILAESLAPSNHPQKREELSNAMPRASSAVESQVVAYVEPVEE